MKTLGTDIKKYDNFYKSIHEFNDQAEGRKIVT